MTHSQINELQILPNYFVNIHIHQRMTSDELPNLIYLQHIIVKFKIMRQFNFLDWPNCDWYQHKIHTIYYKL